MRAKEDASMSSMTEIDARVRCEPEAAGQSSSQAFWILKRSENEDRDGSRSRVKPGSHRRGSSSSWSAMDRCPQEALVN